mmetsp:Transcript_93814/g.265348  ORF Transcript_93814/g.265348 Transcript_93814/m.265348 type:complete len:239 (+) Transcript_93814:687-1403(+)
MRDQVIVHVAKGVIGLLLGLLLAGRHVRELQQSGPVADREAVVVVVVAAPPEPHPRPNVLDQAGERQAEEDKHPELRLEVQEAVAPQAVHLLPEEGRAPLHKADVKQYEVRVDELQQHDLHQHLILVLRLCSVVLALCQVLRNLAQEVVHTLNEDGNQDLEADNAEGHLVLHLMPQVHETTEAEDEDDSNDRHSRGTLHVPPESLVPWVERLHLRCHGVDPRLAVVLRPARLQRVHQV